MLFNVSTSESDLRQIFSRVDYETWRERARADLAFFSSYLPLSLTLSYFSFRLSLLPPLLLLLLFQKFRLPGKSWDPIIRVSSIVMQITITNRRQGRSPDDIAGKESLGLPFPLLEAESSTWHPIASRTFSMEEARKRCRSWQLRVQAGPGSSTSRFNVQTIKILITSGLLFVFPLLVFFPSHLHCCALKILLLARARVCGFN